MTWKQLLTAGKIKQHRTSKAELDDLREAVEVKLKDAASDTISPDTRFATAFGAALLLAKIALACSGYRLDPKAGGHHITAFEALPLSVGAGANGIARYFDVCRRKRNEIDYDRAFVASEADTTEIVRRASELQTMVEDWISQSHPTLAK